MEEHVNREIDDHRPRGAAGGDAIRVRHNAWDLFDGGHAVGEFADGVGQHDLVVEALEAVGLGVAERWRRGDYEDGRAVGECGGEAREGVAEAEMHEWCVSCETWQR